MRVIHEMIPDLSKDEKGQNQKTKTTVMTGTT